MVAQKRPAQTHRARRQPNTVAGPMIVGTQRSSAQQRPTPRRPTGSISEPRGLGLPRDPSEARTHLEPKASGVALKPRMPTQATDSTSAKLLVIASMMSLVVVVLSIAVLTKTTTSREVNIQTDAPMEIQTTVRAPAEVKDAKQPAATADLMLTLDVEPKDASLVVQPTNKGFQVKVAASGYQPETRTIEKGVSGKIAVKLAPSPKKVAHKKKKAAKKSARKRSVAKKGPTPDAEVFLTGSDL